MRPKKLLQRSCSKMRPTKQSGSVKQGHLTSRQDMYEDIDPSSIMFVTTVGDEYCMVRYYISQGA